MKTGYTGYRRFRQDTIDRIQEIQTGYRRYRLDTGDTDRIL